jgi:GNAT superfamily N-acetyltransferase
MLYRCDENTLQAIPELRQSLTATAAAGRTRTTGPVQVDGGHPYRVYSAREQPEARRRIEETDAVAHPVYLLRSDFIPHWPAVYREFPEYQIVLWDTVSGAHLAHGNMVPFHLDGGPERLPCSAVEMVKTALRHKEERQAPTVVGALQAVVNPRYQGLGLSSAVLRAMVKTAAGLGFDSLYAPIRPSQKASLPLTPFDVYVESRRSDGMPIDAWQRVHVRLGATPVGIAPQWLTVRATVGEWSWWTGQPFPASGRYSIGGGLVPLIVDVDENVAVYHEPHLWMYYPIERG